MSWSSFAERRRRPQRVSALLTSALRATLVVALVSTSAARASAEDDAPRPPIWQLASGAAVVLFPSSDVYPLYVADPHRPTNAITVLAHSHVDIDDADSPRASLHAGGRFGILRIDPAEPGGRSWQVSISAGLNSVFDSKYKLDSIGWDGNYGVTIATATGGPLALKFALLHTSSHVGDEYQDRTGWTRRNYTREEVAVGASWRLTPQWEVYGETALAFITRFERQDPWRVQGGAQYEARPTLLGGRFSWYAAGDLLTMQERGWRLDTALKTGIVTRTDGRAYRLGIGWTDGRPNIGEFFDRTERWLTLGFWIDL